MGQTALRVGGSKCDPRDLGFRIAIGLSCNRRRNRRGMVDKDWSAG